MLNNQLHLDELMYIHEMSTRPKGLFIFFITSFALRRNGANDTTSEGRKPPMCQLHQYVTKQFKQNFKMRNLFGRPNIRLLRLF